MKSSCPGSDSMPSRQTPSPSTQFPTGGKRLPGGALISKTISKPELVVACCVASLLLPARPFPFPLSALESGPTIFIECPEGGAPVGAAKPGGLRLAKICAQAFLLARNKQTTDTFLRPGTFCVFVPSSSTCIGHLRKQCLAK